MSLILSAILLAAGLMSCETTENATAKDFVDVLKLKLRRNNDDYDEFGQENNTSPVSTTPTRKEEKGTDPNLEDIHVEAVRRNFIEPRDVKEDFAVTKKDFSFTVTLPDTTNLTTKTEKVIKAGPLFRSDHKMTLNKEKMEKFKKFMSKNKNLFSEYLSKKKAAQTVVVPTLASRAMPRMPPLPAAVSPPAVASPSASIASPTPATVASGTMRSLLDSRQRMTPKKKENRFDFGGSARAENALRIFSDHMRLAGITTPRDVELDLAPAKGAKINVMRLKGRLCQRNVMLPEGPKYDSKGKMYLGEYMNKYGRDYSNTRRPKMLLPRCCNCCKKSVLGCE